MEPLNEVSTFLNRLMNNTYTDPDITQYLEKSKRRESAKELYKNLSGINMRNTYAKISLGYFLWNTYGFKQFNLLGPVFWIKLILEIEKESLLAEAKILKLVCRLPEEEVLATFVRFDVEDSLLVIKTLYKNNKRVSSTLGWNFLAHLNRFKVEEEIPKISTSLSKISLNTTPSSDSGYARTQGSSSIYEESGVIALECSRIALENRYGPEVIHNVEQLGILCSAPNDIFSIARLGDREKFQELVKMKIEFILPNLCEEDRLILRRMLKVIGRG